MPSETVQGPPVRPRQDAPSAAGPEPGRRRPSQMPSMGPPPPPQSRVSPEQPRETPQALKLGGGFRPELSAPPAQHAQRYFVTRTTPWGVEPSLRFHRSASRLQPFPRMRIKNITRPRLKTASQIIGCGGPRGPRAHARLESPHGARPLVRPPSVWRPQETRALLGRSCALVSRGPGAAWVPAAPGKPHPGGGLAGLPGRRLGLLDGS